MSVYSAITASRVKLPTEKSLLAHLQYVRKLLDKGIIQALVWVDTRDMYADGLTKGSVRRDRLRDLATGKMVKGP